MNDVTMLLNANNHNIIESHNDKEKNTYLCIDAPSLCIIFTSPGEVRKFENFNNIL